MSFDSDYGPYRAHPQDPRTPDEPERQGWEEDNGYDEVLSAAEVDEVIYELLYGNPEYAKKMVGIYLDAAFDRYLKDSKRQDEEDRAADRYNDRWAA